MRTSLLRVDSTQDCSTHERTYPCLGASRRHLGRLQYETREDRPLDSPSMDNVNIVSDLDKVRMTCPLHERAVA
jgi:hypothetical protein